VERETKRAVGAFACAHLAFAIGDSSTHLRVRKDGSLPRSNCVMSGSYPPDALAQRFSRRAPRRGRRGGAPGANEPRLGCGSFEEPRARGSVPLGAAKQVCAARPTHSIFEVSRSISPCYSRRWFDHTLEIGRPDQMNLALSARSKEYNEETQGGH
jgi:hypothetical protein